MPGIRKVSRFKQLPLLFCVAVFLAPALAESFLHLRRGAPPSEAETDDFHFRYVEIHDKFFATQSAPDREMHRVSKRTRVTSQRFLVRKASTTRRIFVLGGSVAVPFANNRATRFKSMLSDALPGLKIEIIGAGVPAYDSYRVSLVHQEIMNYDPDLIIILSGNNEMYSPVRLNLFAYRGNRILRRLWTYRALQRRVRKLLDRSPEWRPPEIARSRRLAEYENNIRSMVRSAKRRGVPTVLCTLPVNFRDYPPMVEPSIWDSEAFLSGWTAWEEGRPRAAAKGFAEFVKMRPEEASGHYRLAKAYEALGEDSAARRHYLRALALDATPGTRCTPQRNEILRAVARSEGAVLADVERAFIQAAPRGLVGWRYFKDGVHWHRGHYPFVSHVVLKAILAHNARRGESLLAAPGRWKLLQSRIFQSYRMPHRLDLNNYDLKQKKLDIAVSWIVDVSSPHTLEISIAMFQSVHSSDPKMLEDVLGKKGDFIRRFSSGLTDKNLASKVAGRWPVVLWHVGEAYRRLKLYPAALRYFEAASAKEKELCRPHLFRALTHEALGNGKKALKSWSKAAETCRGAPEFAALARRRGRQPSR